MELTPTDWLPELADSPGPKYLAIARAMAEDIASGRLSAGTRLPTHRDLAYRLGVTVGTVSRAYAEATRRGLIDGEVGRGTYVRRRIGRDLGEIPPRLERGIDFGLNYPPMGAAERDAFAATLADVAASSDLDQLLTYAPHGGALRHRAAAAGWLGELGVETDTSRVVVTTGAQNGMLVALSALAEPGDVVLVEKLSYPGIVPLAELLGLKLKPIEIDREGVLPEAVEEACRTTAARALYCMPTLHNPTNAVMGHHRRLRLAELARRHGLVLVEDDIYRFLVPDAPPPLANYAPDHTFFVTSAAKQLAPGLRIGAVSAPTAMIPKLERAMRASTWMAAPAMAEVFSRWVEDGTTRRLARAKADEMRRRQAIAAEALAGFEFRSHPASMHLWLALPEPWDDRGAVEALAARGLAVSSGQVFALAPGAGRNRLRVCLGNPPSAEAVREGLELLALTLAEAPRRHASIV